ncbi:DUF6175 family protein [Spirosoma litoris]
MKNFLLNVLLFSLIGLTSFAQGRKSRLMVIPADDLLKRLNCYSEKKVQGVTVVERNYLKAYSDLIDLRFACAAIAEKFAEKEFPLEDLEQTLKAIDDEKIKDDVQDIQTDALTQVLNQVRPDVILELSYQLQKGPSTNRLTFLLAAKDSYTRKVIATIAKPGLETLDADVPTLLTEQVELNLENFLTRLSQHGADIEHNGRTIQLTVRLEGAADFSLDDNCGSSDKRYDQMLEDIIDAHKKEGSDSPTMLPNATGKVIQFTNIRIPYVDLKTKRGLSARNWVDILQKDIQKMCGIRARNTSQGLGEGRLILTR